MTELTTNETIFGGLEQQVLDWAAARNFFAKDGATLVGQQLKSVEELGELAAAVARNKVAEVMDAIGDLLVLAIVQHKLAGRSPVSAYAAVCAADTRLEYDTPAHAIIELQDDLVRHFRTAAATCAWLNTLADIAYTYNFTLVECLVAAYAEIKDRKGTMVKGVFIKEEVAATPPPVADTVYQHCKCGCAVMQVEMGSGAMVGVRCNRCQYVLQGRVLHSANH